MSKSESAQSRARRVAKELRSQDWLYGVQFVALLVASALCLREMTDGPTRALALASLFAGFFTLYLSLRVHVDARIFASWSRRADILVAMDEFDARVARLRPWHSGPRRSLSERIAGARRLRVLRGRWCALQVATIVIAVLSALPEAQ